MIVDEKKSILLVEDDVIIALVEKQQLENKGYRVEHLTSGEKAVDFVITDKAPVDIILMDIDLGSGIDGTQAAALILKVKTIPVVFLSSHIEPEIVEKTEKITSYGYVVKNSSITVLDASIKMAFKLLKANQKLQESNKLLSNLAALVPSVIYQFKLYPDGSSMFPYASPGMYDIYEVTPEQVKDDASLVYTRLHPDDYAHVVNSIQESAKTLATFYCEFRVILPEKGLRWRWSQAQPERLADGSILWHGIISDITERKLAELELQEKNTLISTIMETSPVGIVTVDKNGRITYANKRAEDILGLVKDQITQTPYDAPQWRHIDLDGSPLSDEKQPYTIVKRTMKTAFNIQHGISWPDGSIVYLSINASPMLDDKGTFNGMVASIEKISKPQSPSQ